MPNEGFPENEEEEEISLNQPPTIFQLAEPELRKRDKTILLGRGNGGVPLSILDNIDTLRRGLMRELAMRRLQQDTIQSLRSSERRKTEIGKRK